MTETERLKKLKAALQTAMVRAVEAEGWLEDAAELAELTPDKAEEIWALKLELNRLGIRIREAASDRPPSYGPDAEALASHLVSQRMSVIQGAFRILGWSLVVELTADEEPVGEASKV